MSFNVKGAIVTGASGGIGLCVAQSLLKEGFKIIIADVRPLTDKARILLSDFEQNFRYIDTDIAEEESVKKMVAFAGEHLDSLDLLVNNAATSCTCPPQELPLSKWQRVIATNLTGTFLCSRLCAERLKQSSGAIVNIASTRALMSEPNTEAYSATKAGIIGLTHSMAMSLGASVRVNSISPGWIDTSDYSDQPSEPLSEEDHSQHPCGRVGRPEDIAAMTLYLGSEKAGFITGQNFTIDGGMTKKMIYLP